MEEADDVHGGRISPRDGGAQRTTNSGAEDGAVAKRKVEDADQSRGNGVGDLRTSGGGLRRVCPIVAKPPPLIAAVLPWEGKDEMRTEKVALTYVMAEEALNTAEQHKVTADEGDHT